MHRYWDSLIRPICEAVRPQVIVEVGSAGGLNTRRILEWCRDHGARAHVIDPVPLETGQGLADLLASAGTFHQRTSLEVLPELSGDLFLIDGDHNWHTVLGELRAIEQAAEEAGGALPVVLLHDVGWPYGRRDLYYEPERIPAERRQPFARRGIVYGRSELAPEGGFNYRHDNALSEGGARNGVMTAVEDFLAGSRAAWRLATFPLFHGLAVLHVPGALPAEALDRLEPLLEIPPHLRQLMQAVEEERILLLCELVETYRRLGGPPGRRIAALVRTTRRLADGVRGRSDVQAVDGR